MNSRIPPNRQFSKKVKHKLAEAADEYVRGRQARIIQRVMKAFCYVLNRKYKFGHDKLLNVMNEVDNLVDQHEQDEAFWEHLDHVVIDELKLDDKFIPETIDLEGNFIDE